MTEHCKRSNGTERAWFRTREEAEAFAADPENPAYAGDIPALCAKCDLYHLSKPEWLEPVLTARDAQFLEDIGVTAPQRMDDYFRCAICGTIQREGIEYLILEDGKMVCQTNCAKPKRMTYGQFCREQHEHRRRAFAELSDAERHDGWESRKKWLWNPPTSVTWETVNHCPACSPHKIVAHAWPTWFRCRCGTLLILDRWLPDSVERITMRASS